MKMLSVCQFCMFLQRLRKLLTVVPIIIIATKPTNDAERLSIVIASRHWSTSSHIDLRFKSLRAATPLTKLTQDPVLIFSLCHKSAPTDPRHADDLHSIRLLILQKQIETSRSVTRKSFCATNNYDLHGRIADAG